MDYKIVLVLWKFVLRMYSRNVRYFTLYDVDSKRRSCHSAILKENAVAFLNNIHPDVTSV